MIICNFCLVRGVLELSIGSLDMNSIASRFWPWTQFSIVVKTVASSIALNSSYRTVVLLSLEHGFLIIKHSVLSAHNLDLDKKIAIQFTASSRKKNLEKSFESREIPPLDPRTLTNFEPNLKNGQKTAENFKAWSFRTYIKKLSFISLFVTGKSNYCSGHLDIENNF